MKSPDRGGREFVSLANFDQDWKALGLGDAELRELQDVLLENPLAGDVIQGTNGVRKLRFAYRNKGKSGSARVLYVDFVVYEKVYFLAAYAKSNQGNITQKERNEWHDLVAQLKSILERGKRK